MADKSQEILRKITEELSQKGSSDLMKELFLQDFEEIPVSYREFISNPYYLGNSTGNGKGIYPY